MRPLLCALCSLAAIAAPFAQSNPGSVEGKAVNAITGAPVKKAVVTIRSRGGQNSYFTVTDAAGKFHLDGVQPEKYIASADAEGYSSIHASSNIRIFTVAAEQQVTGIDIPIAPLAIVTGKVRNEDGDPVEGVDVTAMRYSYAGPTPMLQSYSIGRTDDRGIYRLFDVQPGVYYLSASAPPPDAILAGNPAAQQEVYAPAIYPGGASISQASAHALKSGEEWTADFKLRKQPAYHIRGRITGGSAAARRNILAQRCDPDPIPSAFLENAGSRQNGVFDFHGAVPGTYCLEVRQPAAGGIALRQTVTVTNADIDGLALNLPAPFNIGGSVAIEGTPPASTPALSIMLRAPGQNPLAARVGPDFTFQFENAIPREYEIVLPVVPQFYTKRIAYGSDDVSNGVLANPRPGASLTVVLGTDPGEIDGTVAAGSLESGSPVLIALVPTDWGSRRFDLARVSGGYAEGPFTFPALAPGDYKLFALDSQNFEDGGNRALLKLLEAQAVSVTVHAGMHEQAAPVPIPAADIERAKERLR